MSDHLTPDEIRRLCEACEDLSQNEEGVAGGYFWYGGWHFNALHSASIIVLAASVRAECAKPERGGWFVSWTKDGVVFCRETRSHFVCTFPIRVDHTVPHSVAVAECRCGLEVLVRGCDVRDS